MPVGCASWQFLRYCLIMLCIVFSYTEIVCFVVGVEQVGSVRHVEMLFRTNLIAIVGGGSNPKYADNSGMYLLSVSSYWWPVIAAVNYVTFEMPVGKKINREQEAQLLLRDRMSAAYYTEG